MRVTRAAAAALCLVYLGGCAAWSARLIPPDQSAYPQRATDMGQARSYAQQTLTNFRTVETRIEDIDTAASVGLLGLALASGWNLAGDHSRGPLKTFAFAGATILGIREVAKPDDQVTVIQKSIDAIKCVINIDDSITQIKNTPSPQLSGQTLSLSTNNVYAFTPDTTAAITNNIRAAITSPALAASLVPAQQTLVRYNSAHLTARDAVAKLTAEYAAKQADAERARILTRTVDDVIEIAIRELRKLNDPTAIDAAISKQFSGVKKKIDDAKKATEDAQATPPPGEPALAQSSILVAQNNSGLTMIMSTLKPWTDAVKACTDPKGES